jgi:hypothetical protein
MVNNYDNYINRPFDRINYSFLFISNFNFSINKAIQTNIIENMENLMD